MTRPEFAPAGGPLIYVVDDAPCLMRLYTLLLEGAGYRVRTFNDRAAALAALNMDERKPELLITDYNGHSMSFESFMDQCLMIHPALRIMMASGALEADMRLCRLRPHRFIRKPFDPGEFRKEIEEALAPVDFASAPQDSARPSPPATVTPGPRHSSKKRNSS